MDYFASGAFADIFDFCLYANTVLGFFELASSDIETSIRQTVSERIEYFVFGKGLEISVSYVNVFAVFVVFQSSEMRGRGVVVIVQSNRIGEFCRGIDFARQYVCYGIAAFHTALPSIYERGNFAFVIFRPRHIYYVARVNYNHGFFERGSYLVEQSAFIVGQIIASFSKRVFSVLSGGTVYNYNRDVVFLCCFFNYLCGKRCFGVAHRPMSPPTVAGLVFGNSAPFEIEASYVFVDLQISVFLCVCKGFVQIYFIGRVYVAAAAVSYVKPVKLTSAEYSSSDLVFKRQYAVVFKQHTAVRTCLTYDFSYAGSNVSFSLCGIFFLHKTVSRKSVAYFFD